MCGRGGHIGYAAAVLMRDTDPRWLETALAKLDDVLVDHAHCEKKAAATALSLIGAYPDHEALVRRMTSLAIEELRHFRAVHDRIHERGLVLGRDPGDPYAKRLRDLVRDGRIMRLTDRLLVAALIEARSHERLSLLAGGIADASLSGFYASLAQAEQGHARLFVELAERYDPDGTRLRLAELSEREAEIVADLPLLPRIH